MTRRVALLALPALVLGAAAAAAAPGKRAVLVVPDVRGQVYVFAEGMLQDGGFAWRVGGSVEGYAANVVAAQTPAPGTRLLDTGAPLVVLTLKRNGRYDQRGFPQNASPYPGTAVRFADLAAASRRAAVTPEPKPKPRPKMKAKPKPEPKAKPAAEAAPKPKARPAAFRAPGVPREPLDELPLPARARLLARWVEEHPQPTQENVKHWLYQHAWVVTGARFGWWHGKEALEILVGVDRRVQQLWGMGWRSEAVARSALGEVEAR